MSFKGNIDFQRATQFVSEEVVIYNAYESPDVYVLPDSLGLAIDQNGRPDLTITLVKVQNSFSLTPVYGTLDLRLNLQYPTEKATQAIRKAGNKARLIPAACLGGFLQLQPVNSADVLPAELLPALPAEWNLVGPTHFLFRLDPNSVTLLKESLKSGVLLFKARALLECRGMAVRLPLKVSFNPKNLLTLIQKQPVFVNGQIQVSELRNYFNQHAELLPITISGNRDQETPGLFADAMVDRFLNRFGKLAAPAKDGQILFTIPNPAETADGNFDWDLSEELEISRVLDLQLNPVEAAEQLAKQDGGIETSLKEVLIPAFQTGFKLIHVSANIPSYRPNVLKAGVQITSAPHVPERMQAISESVEFKYPQDSSDIMLRFSPHESGQYQLRPFMLLNGIKGVHNISGSETPDDRDMLLLKSDDFDVQFLIIEAAPDLLEIATLTVSFIDTNTGKMLSYEINKINPLLSVGFTQSDTLPATMQITAKSIASGSVIKIPEQKTGSMLIGLHHFAEYGFHNIRICCQFTGKKSAVRIELKSELASDNEPPVLCFFTPDKNCADWGYYADSPFSCGYRYRMKKEDSTTGEWSALQSPFVSLSIEDSFV